MVNLPNLRGLGGQIGIQFAIIAARGFLNKAIENETPDKLYLSIMENKHILGNINPNTLQSADTLKQKWGFLLAKVKDSINTQLILQWLEQDRSDLYSIIVNTDGGLEWLDGEVHDIKENILYS